jgi:hypothetical protein
VGTVVPEPESGCWLHPDVGIGPSSIAQLGLFARVAISPGAVVSRLGGCLVTGTELQRIFREAALRPAHRTWTRSLLTTIFTWSCPLARLATTATTAATRICGGPTGYTQVARRLIAAGEEITSDYATCTGVASSSMACCCGSSLCRGVITGDDWRLPDLQARYGHHWIPALLDRIRQA